MIAWLLLSVVACDSKAPEAWAGTFRAEEYRIAEIPPPEPTVTYTTAASADVGCDAEPVVTDWGRAAFSIELAGLGDTDYIEIAKCDAPDECEYIPWTAAGSTDLGPDGGTATLAASNFLASSLGGGICTLYWWNLAITGTVDAPSIELVTESGTTELEEGDAPDCEALLGERDLHSCTGRYLLDGTRW